jgi:hypothetical protein
MPPFGHCQNKRNRRLFLMNRYLIDNLKDGFIVRGRPHRLDTPGQPQWRIDLAYDESRLRREPVTVHRRPYYLAMESSDLPCCFTFFSFPSLVHAVAEMLMRPWHPPVLDHDGPDEEEHHLYKLKEWAVKRTERAINKPVYAEWRRLLSQVDPTVLAVHRQVFSATWGYRQANIIANDDLFKEKYIVKDILAYRAAAVATLLCEAIGPANETPIERMQHWHDLYAPAGMGAYRALNVTLTNLPGGIPAGLLSELRNVILTRPIHNRLELITTILAGARTADNFSVFANATAVEIKEAIRRVSISLHRQRTQTPPTPADLLSPRRTRDIRTVVHYLLDFPEDHRGRILGLVEKAIRWHGTDGRQAEARKSVKRFGMERQLARPPIPLPTTEGIRLLTTVADAVSEGEQMEHCIASYCEKAVEGRCYLFHADHKGERASVEVSPSGRVVQAFGPRNGYNAAAKWATQMLGQWGHGLRSKDEAEISQA